MLYLLDANVLITAKNTYYPLKQVPEFWEWLIYNAQKDQIKIPYEIFEELSDPNKKKSEKDDLAQWIENDNNKDFLKLDEEIEPELIQIVIKEYSKNPITNVFEEALKDNELEDIENDAFLIAYALKNKKHRCVVTTEISRPKSRRQNKKIPDICKGLGINCCNTFEFNKQLNFNTNWKSKI